jgi:hypothetical protein
MRAARATRACLPGSWFAAAGTFWVVAAAHAQATGACCLPDFTCEVSNQSACLSLNGAYQGDGSSCTTVACPTPGACCLGNASCAQTGAAQCVVEGGVYHGDNTACETTACPAGACCAASGTCSILIPTVCVGSGGVYRGDGSACAAANCPVPPGTWVESGDAGDFFENCDITTGNGALILIQGALDTDDADMYAIQICDPVHFSASTVVGNRLINPQLFLLDANGFGVVADENGPDGALPSRISNMFTSSRLPGLYYVAVSSFDKEPWDFAHELIWGETPFGVERAPDGLGAADPLSSWSAGAGATGQYAIALTGACFAQPSASACYPNCDGSTQPPILNVNDLVCFLNRFAAGDSYANCDGSSAAPILNALDFVCFLDRFVAGCP